VEVQVIVDTRAEAVQKSKARPSKQKSEKSRMSPMTDPRQKLNFSNGSNGAQKTNGADEAETAPGSQQQSPEATLFEAIDRIAHTNVAKATSWFAPSVLVEALAVRLGILPGKLWPLAASALQDALAFWADVCGVSPAPWRSYLSAK
jgi:hypothetical protein